MGQVLSIYLPAWDVELLLRKTGAAGKYAPKRHRHQAVMLISTTGREESVARCCGVARQAGVVPGMSVAEARALCPTARRLPFDFEKSRHSLTLLAKWCRRFSPVVTVDPTPAGHHQDDLPDGMLLEVTGVAHLFGGEHLLVNEIATRLRNLGFGTRLAIAPTIGAAWALARFGQSPAAIVGEEQLPEALGPLPVVALRLSVATCAALHQVGIEQVRHLLKLSRESLLARYGEDLLFRLDQAFGRMNELIEPLRVTELLAVQRLFDGGATQIEAVMITVEELLSELSQRLLHRESGVRGLRVELARIDALPVSREFVLGRPSRDPKHLWKLVHPKIESMHMGHGVEGVTVTAYWTETIRHEQSGAWGIGQSQDAHDHEYAAFLDTLVGRWGSKRVLMANAVASHVPEVARQFQPVGEQKKSGTAAALLFMDRPSVLFDQPESAQGMALQPDYPPAWIQWRGQEYVLQKGTGPERIVTEWWGEAAAKDRRGASTRDYFKVQTAGASWLWVFRELESSRWFVHGIWA
jgi:protein ImuB